MSNLVITTKEQILELLKKYKQLSVAELASFLNITEMAVRRHLNTLEKEKMVQTVLVRKAMGRPINLYQLTEAGEESFPRNYANLTIDLLRDIEELSGEEMVHQLFIRRKKRLLDKYEPVLQETEFAAKIAKLAQIQNENGYMVEWERNDDGSFSFKEYNCPISRIAQSYPIACQCEQELFQEILQTSEIECKACFAIDDSPYCYYKIKES